MKTPKHSVKPVTLDMLRVAHAAVVLTRAGYRDGDFNTRYVHPLLDIIKDALDKGWLPVPYLKPLQRYVRSSFSSGHTPLRLSRWSNGETITVEGWVTIFDGDVDDYRTMSPVTFEVPVAVTSEKPDPVTFGEWCKERRKAEAARVADVESWARTVRGNVNRPTDLLVTEDRRDY